MSGAKANVTAGKVKAWNLAKGFGFVVDGSGNEAFVHISDINGGRLIEGSNVKYETKTSTRTSKDGTGNLVAFNLKGPGVQARPTKRGKLRGHVKSWKHSKSIGFITGSDGTDVYVHNSAFGGGTLIVGRSIFYDVEDVGHKSGRLVATNVSGDGVRELGKHQGKVTKWIANKGYGFVDLEDGSTAFIHRSEIGDGYCEPGKPVYFNLHKTDNGQLVAVSVSGPAVRDPEPAEGGYYPQKDAYPSHANPTKGGGKGSKGGGKSGKGSKGGKSGSKSGKGGKDGAKGGKRSYEDYAGPHQKSKGYASGYDSAYAPSKKSGYAEGGGGYKSHKGYDARDSYAAKSYSGYGGTSYDRGSYRSEWKKPDWEEPVAYKRPYSDSSHNHPKNHYKHDETAGYKSYGKPDTYGIPPTGASTASYKYGGSPSKGGKGGSKGGTAGAKGTREPTYNTSSYPTSDRPSTGGKGQKREWQNSKSWY